MTSLVQPLTTLEAVNEIISTVGQTPVNDLAGGLPADAEAALSKLKRSSREVQGEGWDFNTEFDYPLTRTLEKEIHIPKNIYNLDVQCYRHLNIDPVQRAGRMYDRKNKTFLFEQDLVATVIWLFDFEDLTEPAKDYVFIKASRMFQASFMSSELLNAFTTRDERDAMLRFKRAHQTVKDNNIFNKGGFNYSPSDVQAEEYF